MTSIALSLSTALLHCCTHFVAYVYAQCKDDHRGPRLEDALIAHDPKRAPVCFRSLQSVYVHFRKGIHRTIIVRYLKKLDSEHLALCLC